VRLDESSTGTLAGDPGKRGAALPFEDAAGSTMAVPVQRRRPTLPFSAFPEGFAPLPPEAGAPAEADAPADADEEEDPADAEPPTLRRLAERARLARSVPPPPPSD